MDQIARTEASTLVSIQNCRQSYPKDASSDVIILDDVQLSLREGEIVGLLGRSGSGKSTLLRIVSGLLKPTAGDVRWRGQPITGPVKGVSMVFQSFALFPWLTVEENVALGLEAQGVPRGERTTRAEEAIDLIGLGGYENAYPKELSGGMRQRVGLARALVVHPDLLLMDEPFSALDVLTAENLRTELIELWETGEFPAQSILIVTHNIEEAVMFADRVIVLGTNPGRIKRELAIDIQRPRDRKSPEFEALVDEIYGVMTERPAPVAAPVDVSAESDEPEAGGGRVQYVMLPHASVDGIAGLAELSGQAAADADLGDLAAVVGFEIDDLFPLVDALGLLGFANVVSGRLELTPLGREFAGADIQHSKEIFREAALERVPLVRRVHRALEHSADGALREGFFLDLLNRHFSVEEARAQLDTAIDWGRYAELFEYNSGRGEIMLPEPAEPLRR